MTKEEKMIQLVNDNLYKCVKSTAATVHTYGNIPYKALAGALSKYLNIDYDEQVIGLIDTTVFGSGKNGAAFTTKGFYMKDMMFDPIFIDYEHWFNINTNNDSVYYNLSEISDLMMELSSIEDDNTWGDVAREIGGIVKDTVVNAFIDEMDEYDRQEQEGMAELANILENCQKILQEIFGGLSDLVSKEVDVYSDDLDDFLNAAYKYNALVVEHSMIGQCFSEEYIDSMNDIANAYSEALDLMCELDSENGHALKKATKNYSRKINALVRDYYEKDKINGFDAYKIGKDAMTTYNVKLKNAIDYIDEILDEYYDED